MIRASPSKHLKHVECVDEVAGLVMWLRAAASPFNTASSLKPRTKRGLTLGLVQQTGALQ